MCCCNSLITHLMLTNKYYCSCKCKSTNIKQQILSVALTVHTHPKLSMANIVLVSKEQHANCLLYPYNGSHTYMRHDPSLHQNSAHKSPGSAQWSCSWVTFPRMLSAAQADLWVQQGSAHSQSQDSALAWQKHMQRHVFRQCPTIEK